MKHCGKRRTIRSHICKFGELILSISLLSNLSGYDVELQSKLYTLTEWFEELPAHHKIAFYDQAMKSRTSTMLEKLEEYVQSLKETNPSTDSLHFQKQSLNSNSKEHRLKKDN